MKRTAQPLLKDRLDSIGDGVFDAVAQIVGSVGSNVEAHLQSNLFDLLGPQHFDLITEIIECTKEAPAPEPAPVRRKKNLPPPIAAIAPAAASNHKVSTEAPSTELYFPGLCEILPQKKPLRVEKNSLR